MEREIIRMGKGVIVVTGGAGPSKGGLGRGSGEAQSVSDTEFQKSMSWSYRQNHAIGNNY